MNISTYKIEDGRLLLTYILGAIGIVLAWVFLIADYPLINQFFFAAVLTGLLLWLVMKSEENRPIGIFVVAVFLVKILLAYVFSIQYNLAAFPDSQEYIAHLNSLREQGEYTIHSLLAVADTLHIGHYYFLLIPYLIVGTSGAIVVFHTFLVTAGLFLLYLAFKKDFGFKVALFVLIAGSLSTNLYLFGSGILKDPTVIFLGAVIVYFMRGKRMPYIALMLSLLLFMVRIYSGFAFLVAILVDIYIMNRMRLNSKTLWLRLGSAVALIAILLLAIPFAREYLFIMWRYGQNMLGLDLIWLTGLALVKFLVAPLPWNVIGNGDLYSMLFTDSIFFIIFSFTLILFAYKFFKSKELRDKTWLFLIPIFVHAVVLGYQYGGDSTRQRSGIFIFLVLIIGIGLLYKNELLGSRWKNVQFFGMFKKEKISGRREN